MLKLLQMPTTSSAAVIRVAVVEDDHKYREGLVFLLNASAGLKCVAAVATATEALAQFGTLEHSPDVVLLDLDLGPGEPDGVTSLPALRKLLPTVKFLMLTVLDQPDRVFDAVRCGASGYLRKGASLSRLLKKSFTSENEAKSPSALHPLRGSKSFLGQLCAFVLVREQF